MCSAIPFTASKRILVHAVVKSIGEDAIDAGSEYFSISYFNPDENKEKLFYPDWIMKTKSMVWIIDTKKGSTAEIPDTTYKAEALQVWLKGREGFDGGIAVSDGPNGWKLNNNEKYLYSQSLSGWQSLMELLSK